MAEYLGINPDPQYGGTDGPVTYISFAGPSAQVDKNNYTNHEMAIELGNARAKELMEYFGVNAIKNNKSAFNSLNILRNGYTITLPEIIITAAGTHTVTVTNFKGQQVMSRHGEDAQTYSLPDLSSGLYIIKIATPAAYAIERAIMY